jgi:hypothetical protein
MRHARLVALLLVPLVFGSGCALFVELFTDPMGHKAAFTRMQREYTKFVRWGDIDGAARFVHPDARDEFMSHARDFAGIRVTDFEVGPVTYGPGQTTAEVMVTYSAYSMASMLEKQIKEVQRWERAGAGNQWFVRPKLDGLVEQVAGSR